MRVLPAAESPDLPSVRPCAPAVLIWGPAFLGQGEAAPPAVARGAASGPLMPAVTSVSVVDAWSCSYARVGTAGRVVRRERYRWSDGRAWPRSGLLTDRSSADRGQT